MEKITSRRSSICAHVKNLGKDRSYRAQCGEFICDGKKLLDEAIKCGVHIESILTSAKLEITAPEYTNIYKVPQDILESMSPLKNPQSILFICKTPDSANIDYSTGTHILLDNVQDPGNIGTIIRSADAFGVSSVILTPGCADRFNPKAIRASMGSVFRQKSAVLSIDELQSIKARFIGTTADSGGTPISKAKLKNSIIVLGSEGQGISEDISPLCKEMITIPISDDCESLNVAIAASIIMWEAGKS